MHCKKFTIYIYIGKSNSWYFCTLNAEVTQSRWMQIFANIILLQKLSICFIWDLATLYIKEIAIPITKSASGVKELNAQDLIPRVELGWPAKFREIFHKICISHFTKFLFHISQNFWMTFVKFCEISQKRNVWKFREISRKWSYKTVQKRIWSYVVTVIFLETGILKGQFHKIFYSGFSSNNFSIVARWH